MKRYLVATIESYSAYSPKMFYIWDSEEKKAVRGIMFFTRKNAAAYRDKLNEAGK